MRRAALGLVLIVLALGLAATATGRSSAPAAIRGCGPSNMTLLKSGTLTIGTDNPAFPPYFGGAEKKPWKISNPYSGQGYESAFAYAVASQLGFTKKQVAWTPLVWTASFKPGKKPFDMMDDGRIVEVGRPEEFFADPKEERSRQFLSKILA